MSMVKYCRLTPQDRPRAAIITCKAKLNMIHDSPKTAGDWCHWGPKGLVPIFRESSALYIKTLRNWRCITPRDEARNPIVSHVLIRSALLQFNIVEVKRRGTQVTRVLWLLCINRLHNMMLRPRAFTNSTTPALYESPKLQKNRGKNKRRG